MNELTKKTAANLVFLAMMAERGMQPKFEQELNEFAATQKSAFARGYGGIFFASPDVSEVESYLNKVEKHIKDIRERIQAGRDEDRTDMRGYISHDLIDTFSIFHTVDRLKEHVNKVVQKQTNVDVVVGYIYSKHAEEQKVSSAAFQVVHNYNPLMPVYPGDIIQAELNDGSTDTFKVVNVGSRTLTVYRQLKTKWSEKPQSLGLPGNRPPSVPGIVNFTILEKNNPAHNYVHLFEHLVTPVAA